MLQLIMDGMDIGMGKVQPWFLAWVVVGLVSLPALPLLVHPMQKGARDGTGFLRSSRPAYPDLYHQGQLYYVAQARCRGHSRVLQIEMGKASSPALMISG